MAARDDSNIFDFYSNLMSNEPDMSSEIASASYFALDAGASNTSFHEGFPEWSSFSRFCKSLIHSIFQNLGAKGKEDLLERVKSCHSHEEIVSIADEEQIINITVDMLLQEANDRTVDVKDAIAAKRLREEGNGLFKRKDYIKSLAVYSKAISLAPHDDQEFSLSLANRSAAFFHLSQFDDCLRDIDLVLEKAIYPEERLYIVFGRKIQCLRYLGRDDDANAVASEAIKSLECKITDESLLQMNSDVIKTSLEKTLVPIPPIEWPDSNNSGRMKMRPVDTQLKSINQLLPSASSKVRMVDTQSKRGRIIEATSNIDPSEVIIAEKPFVLWCRPSVLEEFCSHCLTCISTSNVKKHFIPCVSCISVRFCSRQCYDEAMRTYHWIECRYMDVLSVVSSGQLALRMVLKEGLDRSLELFQSDPQKNSQQPYLNDYKSVLDLVDHLNERTAEDKISLAVAAIFIARLVASEVESEIGDLDLGLFATLLYKHILQIGCNVIGIDFDYGDPEGKGCTTLSQQSPVIGIGIYPTVSLLNHSCERKTYRVFRGSKLCLKSSDSFEPGQEITFNYGPFYQQFSCKDRRSLLLSNFYFECDCNACSNKLENIGSSFNCPSCCEGPVIANYVDKSNYCLKCHAYNVIDLDTMLEKVEQLRTTLEVLWDQLEDGHINQVEQGLDSLVKTYGKYFYEKSHRIIEVKEKYAYLCELKKDSPGIMKQAMTLWLQCYYGTTTVEGQYTYEALFFLLKITAGLIEEADAAVEDKKWDKVKSNLDKINKYYKRALSISKKLRGREAKLLEAREEILINMPDMTSLAKDISNISTLVDMLSS